MAELSFPVPALSRVYIMRLLLVPFNAKSNSLVEITTLAAAQRSV